MSTKAYRKKQARNHMLSCLNMVYPSPMRMDSICRCIIPINATYDMDLLAKDISYLADKGYVVLTTNGPFGGRLEFKAQLAKLTAAGKEVADQIVDDPALEI